LLIRCILASCLASRLHAISTNSNMKLSAVGLNVALVLHATDGGVGKERACQFSGLIRAPRLRRGAEEA
jgi:hypothetical protein